MLTYLHHSDPTIPHYRKPEWTFLRGALATVDRPFLGWVGRFFLHNVSHDHVSKQLLSWADLNYRGYIYSPNVVSWLSIDFFLLLLLLLFSIQHRADTILLNRSLITPIRVYLSVSSF